MEEWAKEIGFVVLGFVLAHLPIILDRRRKLKTHWSAIRAEMVMCKEKAETLLKSGIETPLYRLPVAAFETSFPILLAEGAVAESELLILGRFSGLVQDINRGLDYSAEMYKAENAQKLRKEHNRNCLKARALVHGKNGKESAFKPAKKIVDYKIGLWWWKY